jgi:catechol 2,3-dioxygenase-like lactoylglutathione lyase family enzyme
MAAVLESVHPVLMSADVSLSVAFYERLGFRSTYQDDPVAPVYAAVTRDAVTLHLQWHADAKRSNGHDRPVYRFVVSDVDEIFAALRQAEVIRDEDLGLSPWASPGDTSWGTREFHIRDPYGNGLQFYRPHGGGIA